LDVPKAAATADMVATSRAAEEETPLPSGTAEDACSSTNHLVEDTAANLCVQLRRRLSFFPFIFFCCYSGRENVKGNA
jgi:hypothetical protein